MPIQTRQLAAILFTDIVGYTALMGSDENQVGYYVKEPVFHLLIDWPFRKPFEKLQLIIIRFGKIFDGQQFFFS